MIQLPLSTDLSVITAEINSFKQVAGHSLFEIGRRLKHVKENDLIHGQWGSWLQSNVGFTERQARRFIQASDEFKTDDVVRIGSSKIFEMLSLPESVDRSEFIEQEHEIPSSGESKKPEDMTVKELREVKQALKDAELRARNAETARQLAINQHSEQQDKLLAQIDELKKKKAPTASDKEELRRLTEENGALTQAIRTMQDEHLEKYSALENKQHDLRKMKEALSKTRAYVEVDLANALMHFGSISNQKEAIETAEHFWNELDETISKMRVKWLKAMNNQIEEVGGNAGRVVVIDG